MSIPPHIRRLLVHILLAVFLANAANKFFVPDLEYEAIHHFYARIFAFQGDAPDQYRILPLLPLKVLCTALPFNSAVLIYNTVAAFLVFELLWLLMRGISDSRKYATNLILSATYIYFQYTGWRPDTLGLLLICTLTVLAADRIRDPLLRDGSLLLGTLAIAFSRADIALAFAAYFALYKVRSLPIRLLLPGLPVFIQLVLQTWVFPDAQYYTQTIMLWDNLSAYYIIRHPATYLIIALLILYARPLAAYALWIWKRYPGFCFIVLGYLGLILVVGRLNEYRLYLPFLPLLLTFWSERTRLHEKETRTL